jgi:hypothetical protein
MLYCPIQSLQGFQPIARPGQKIAQRCRDVQGVQTTLRRGFDVYETRNPLSSEQAFGVGAAERLAPDQVKYDALDSYAKLMDLVK